jgi:hypothetical protein
MTKEMTRPGASVVAFLAAAVAAGASGCGGSQASRIDSMHGADTTAVSAPGKAETALLAAIRVARRQGYDRVVFRFANALPGYRISYVRPPFREDGSGKPIAVNGSAFVLVRMEPASGYDLSNDRLVYRGPRRVAGADHGASTVREVVRTGDFESAAPRHRLSQPLTLHARSTGAARRFS